MVLDVLQKVVVVDKVGKRERVRNELVQEVEVAVAVGFKLFVLMVVVIGLTEVGQVGKIDEH
jgi:spore maturation protein SpmA